MNVESTSMTMSRRMTTHRRAQSPRARTRPRPNAPRRAASGGDAGTFGHDREPGVGDDEPALAVEVTVEPHPRALLDDDVLVEDRPVHPAVAGDLDAVEEDRFAHLRPRIQPDVGGEHGVAGFPAGDDDTGGDDGIGRPAGPGAHGVHELRRPPPDV